MRPEPMPFVTQRVRYGDLPHQTSVITRAAEPLHRHPPVIGLFASGGGFVGGGLPAGPNPLAPYWSELLLERGWAIGGVGYGLAPEFKYPASPNGDIRKLVAHIRENSLELGLGTSPIIVAMGQSAGATSWLRNAVDATIPTIEQPDALVLTLALSNFPALNFGNDPLWLHFGNSTKKVDVPLALMLDAGAATFLADDEKPARIPPPTFLHYSSPAPASTGALYAFTHDAAHGFAVVTAMDACFPGAWSEPTHRMIHDPGVQLTAAETAQFVRGALFGRTN